ncbi:MAG: S53 family peptidase [Thermoguttaceae bacterium]
MRCTPFSAKPNRQRATARSCTNACHRGRSLRLESLESRSLLSVSPLGVAVPCCVATAADDVAPMASASPTGYSPAQIRHAYGFDQVTFSNGAVAGDGAGTTIAIVDAYDDPTIAEDLHQFNLEFGLPDCVFTKVNQYGGTDYPDADRGWATEIALDVEWAHAIAPGANILLVEAASASMSDLLTAVDYARRAAGVVVVSMSWGTGEFRGETNCDSYFTTPAGHTGVTFLAASGDDGAPVGYPATSPNVISVGGTTLSLNGQGVYQGESAWSGSGGGVSKYEAQPSYQRGVVTQSAVYRANPDVSYDSNPSTGFSVYDSFNNGTSTPWGQWGGTSAAAPQWAALIAIADQGRMLAGNGSLDGATQTLPMLYAAPSTHFHDITSGSSTGSPHYSATAGYDLVTGRGTPVADLLVADLAGTGSTSTPAPPTISSIVVAEATLQNGILESNEQGVVTWAATSSSQVVSKSLLIDGSPALATYGPYGPYSGGVYYYSGVFGPLTAGTHSYQVRMTNADGLTSTASGSFVVSATAAPVVSSVVVAEASAQNGVLTSNEQGVVTWATTNSAPIASRSLTIDGATVNPTNGPYGPYNGGVFYYSGVFGPLSAGTHTYQIRMTDTNGQSGTASGSFTVTATSAPVISSVVVAEAVGGNGILESNEQGVVTWAVTDPSPLTSRSLRVDGVLATANYGPYGPYGGGAYYYSAVFGPLTAGAHSYVIQVSDSGGGAASYNGTFSVATPARSLTSATALPALVGASVRSQTPTAERIRSAPATRSATIAMSSDVASRMTIEAESLGQSSDDDHWTAAPATAATTASEITTLDRTSPASGPTAAERVELLDAVVREWATGDSLLDLG